MGWLWRRLRPAANPVDNGEGQQAREDAVDRLADVDDRWVEVNKVSESLRELRRENQFAEQIHAIFRGKAAGK